jgi:hypothetical protein
MIPWERDVYIGMIKNYVNEQEKKQRERRNGR